MLLLKKSEIIGICFSQIIEISQENSNTIAIYFLRCEVIDSEEKNHYYNAIYSCTFLYFDFFPKLKTTLKHSSYIDLGLISVIPLVTTSRISEKTVTYSSILSGNLA